ncbi:MAG: ornithine cyclodeaminase family protein [Thaumarchaeota archaeon]|nr:ornithine cyclodeaminase family protein [Nitrososphaerota archaeon]MCL5316637.1 ornithine cyclodeaminase family protein [Nitrososphaerota archaeon]
MVLILQGQEIQQILKMRDTVPAVEEAFRQLGEGQVQMPPRQLMLEPERGGWIAVMPAYIKKTKALATKVVTVYPENPTVKLPTTMATIVLNDPDTGQLLAVMDGAYITAVRTGAVGGVAAKYLARSDAQTVGIFGAGIQARSQLEALCEVRHIKDALVYDLVPEAAEKYAEDMSIKLGIKVSAAKTSKEAVTDRDIIVTASTAKTPVFKGSWLEPGTHITGVGAHMASTREIDTEAVKRSKVVVDLREAAEKECGELLIPLQEKEITLDIIYGELGEIVSGKKKGRVNPREITLFKSAGLAIQDAAAARLAYDKAVKAGVGVHVDL